MKNVDILFEDDDCFILNKPAGLAVQGGEGVGTSLDDLLAAEFSPRPLLVHRLDKDTSGVILVAKHREAASYFAKIIEERDILKIYNAICNGTPNPESGIISLDIEAKGTKKKSETMYKTLFTKDDFSFLELELGTGRMHQIRKHLASIGHPILGDDKYGNFAVNKAYKKAGGAKKLFLHARTLKIPQRNGKTIEASAPLPEYWEAFTPRTH
ncbi:MAG: RluA family pseudouridine synthase [Treponema sp.]|nr:RluA family pseudouridine synthase [Treponema sp.]